MLWGASLYVPGLQECHHVETPRLSKRQETEAKTSPYILPIQQSREGKKQGPLSESGE